jgi:hypothetical protein
LSFGKWKHSYGASQDLSRTVDVSPVIQIKFEELPARTSLIMLFEKEIETF